MDKEDVISGHEQSDKMTYLESLLNESSVPILSLDLKGRFVKWNKGCEELFGHLAIDMINSKESAIIPREEKKRSHEIFKQVLKAGKVTKVNTVRLGKRGDIVEVRATYCATKDKNGVVDGITAVYKDIGKKSLTRKFQEVMRNIAHTSSRRIVDTPWFSRYVYEQLGNIMDVSNFYIVLKNPANEQYMFPVITGCRGLKKAVNVHKGKKSLIAHIIKTGKPLFEQKEELSRYIKTHRIALETALPEVYMGVPLKGEGRTIGVMGALSFKNRYAYSIKNMRALELISSFISNILSRDLIIDELIASEEHYRSLSEKSCDVTSVLDKSLIIQYESLPCKYVFRKDPHKLLGHRFLDDIHPDDKSRVRRNLRHISKARNRTGFEICRYLHGNGDWVWIEMMIKNLLSDEIVNGILIHKRDITKAYERQEALLVSERKFKTVVTQSLEAIYFADPVTTRLIEANQTFLDYTGYSKIETGKIYIKDFVVGPPSGIKAHVKRVLSGDKLVNIERTWRRKSGEEFTVLVSASKIIVNENTVLVVTARDISPQKKNEEELVKINRELDTFVYKASHDLRGPLTTCLGLVNMSHADVMDEKATWYLNMIDNVLNKLDGILKDLTQITAIRQGDVQFTNVNLKQFVDESLSEFYDNPEIDQIVIKIRIDFRKKIRSDAPILRMVFRNLIGNAIKYRKKDGKNPYLSIHAYQEGKQAVIIFKDNGIGVHEMAVKNVFDMFYRGTTESKGSGLGLYMVRTGLDKIGGSITLRSKPGKGSTFKITLPCVNS